MKTQKETTMDKKMNYPKERITQARESWEVRREDSARAKITPEGSQANVKKPDVKEANIVRGRGKRKKLRLKKSVRRTVGSLLLATSIVVAAVPVGDASAVTDYLERTGDNISYEEAPYISESEVTIPTVNEIYDDNDDSPKKYNGHIFKKIAAGSSIARFGFALEMIPDQTDPTKEIPKQLEVGGLYICSKEGFSDAVSPIFEINSAGDLKKYAEPANYANVKLTLNGFYGYNDTSGTYPFFTNYYKGEDDRFYCYEITKEDIQYDKDNNYCRLMATRWEWADPEITTLHAPLHMAPLISPDSSPSDPDDSVSPEGLNNEPTDNSDPSSLNSSDKTDDASGENSGVNNNSHDDNSSENSNSGNSTDKSENESSGTSTESSPDTTTIPTEDNSTSQPSVIETNVDSDIAGISFQLSGVVMVADDPTPTSTPTSTPTPTPTSTPPTPGQWKEIVGSTQYVCKSYGLYENVCDSAFTNIPGGVEELEIPEYATLKAMGDSAFAGTNIKSINLSSTSFTYIGPKCFEGCTNLGTVNLSNSIKNIGDAAFAGCTQLDNVVIPWGASIGAAGFYGDNNLKNLDFGKCTGINVGDYALASTGLIQIDLDNKEQTALSINNLGGVKGLFASCKNLSAVALPYLFTGEIQPGNFQNCFTMTNLYIRNPQADFTEGEFNRLKINVYGPNPKQNNTNMNPDSKSFTIGDVNAYKTCLKWVAVPSGFAGEGKNCSYDYIYHGCTADDNQTIRGYKGPTTMPEFKNDYDYCNQYIDVSDWELVDPLDPDNKKYKKKTFPKLVFKVSTESKYIVGKFKRTGGKNPYDLVIDGGVGVPYAPEGESNRLITINGIGDPYNDKGVFEEDNEIGSLHIGLEDDEYSVQYIGEKAFYKCPQLESVFINTGNTYIADEAFAENNSTDYVEFGKASDGASQIGARAFYNNADDLYVSFYNDDLRKGKETDYANIAPKEIDPEVVVPAIGTNAFGSDSRKQSIVFKGPMDLTYVPFVYAIKGDPKPVSVGDGNYFIQYRSGNPQNLICKYYLEETATDPVLPAGVYLESYPNMTSKIGKDPNFGDDQMTPRFLKEKYDEDHEQVTDIEERCYKCTSDIVIPDGIDYIDRAESKIEGIVCTVPDTDTEYYTLHPMYQADKDTYWVYAGKTYSQPDIDKSYKMFKYVKDLNSVTFKGPQYFPDKMFEGCTDLTEVTFNKDVIRLGYKGKDEKGILSDDYVYVNGLPFYLPDTEGDEVPSHYLKSPSSVTKVNFNKELEDNNFSVGNPRYRGTESGLSLMIKADVTSNNEKKEDAKTVYLDQIVPSRGDASGESIISADELSDINVIKPYAARDCDRISELQLNQASNALYLLDGCFYDCDQLSKVYLPDQITEVNQDSFGHIKSRIDVYTPSTRVTFKPNAFRPTKDNELTNPEAWILAPDDPRGDNEKKFGEKPDGYASKYNNVNFKFDESQTKCKVRFILTETTPQTIVYQGEVGYQKSVEDIVENNPDLKEHLWEGTDLVDLTSKSITALLTHDTDFFTVKSWLVTFTMPDGKTEIGTARVTDGEYVSSSDVPTADEMPELYNGKRFSNKWLPSPTKTKITKDTIIKAVYDTDPTPTPTPTPTVTPTPTSTPSSSSSSSSGSSSSSSRSSSSSSRSSSSSSSSSAYPVYVNSQDTLTPAGAAAPGAGSTVYIDESTGGGSGTGSGSGGKKGSGNANVISTTGGISDTGKISATVNGSSDNYIVKITQTQEADEMGLQALHNEYGEDISPIRYLCFDISLYDSTGTNKISPVPEGVSVTLTMPIPDDLAIYGGNAKICCTSGGVMEKMDPRFTVIDGVPCMTYTCTHFSPYMVWVDTNNLTAAGIEDATPKTADGIHPKWFLCFGLAAIAIVMFLKKDPEEYLKKKAA